MSTERRMTPEEKVVYCVNQLIKVIVVSHNCCPISAFKQVSSPSSSFSDSSARYVYDTSISDIEEFSKLYAKDYISRSWKYDLYTPFTLSIYLRESVECDSLVLIERWTFQCVRGGSNGGNTNMDTNYTNNDNGRASLSRRIGILIRSLYCYVRLLPAFHSNAISSTSLIFKLGTAASTTIAPVSTGTGTSGGSDMLKNEFSFPKLPSSVVGFMIVKVSYMDPDDVKEAPRVRMEQISKHTHAAIPSRLTMPVPIPSSSASNSSKQQQQQQQRQQEHLTQHPSSLPSNATMMTTTTITNRISCIGGADSIHNQNNGRNLQQGDTFRDTNTIDADIINNQRSRSSDSAPLYLQEAIGGGGGKSNSLKQQQHQQCAPSSASSPPFPVNLTPPFSNDYLFSRTPDGNGGGYNISLSTSLIARQLRDSNTRNSGDHSPIIPNLLSTSPQINSIPPIDLSFVRSRNNDNNVISSDPYTLRLSELPASPFDISSNGIGSSNNNHNIKRITNGSDSGGGKARRSSKTSTKSDSMSNDDLYYDDGGDEDDDYDNDNDNDIDEGMFALDEDMPFVCDDDDDIDGGKDESGEDRRGVQVRDNENNNDKKMATPSKMNTGISAFACNDRILNPPVLQLFSRDQQIIGDGSSMTKDATFNENNLNLRSHEGSELKLRGEQQQQQQQQQQHDKNTDNTVEYEHGPRSLIQEFKKFQVAFDTEEL